MNLSHGTKLIINSAIRGAMTLAIVDMMSTGGEVMVKPTIRTIKNTKESIQNKFKKG